MMQMNRLSLVLTAILSAPLVAAAQQSEQTPQAPAEAAAPAQQIEPAAIDLFKAMSSRLAAAKTMSFKASSTYEQPALNGQPLYYTTLSAVTLQRPNKLRVSTPGDGPPTEFYYDGKIMVAYDPAVNLVAVADAPPTLDALAKAAYDQAAIYFPFIDFIVRDPYGDVAESLKSAFVVGQSNVVGGTLTDMVAIATDTVQEELWIGADDHLPRMVRAVFPKEPGTKRYETDFSDWRLDVPIADDAFASADALKAPHIRFARPDGEPQQKP